jgi:putative chitinase
MNWVNILIRCGVRPAIAQEWEPAFSFVIPDTSVFSAGEAEIDDFLGQILHESNMLTRVEESLFYTTPERICAVWPSRFPKIADAVPYVRKPVELANKVYGKRMGNSMPGDGWKYRGRGLLQVTGRDNYRAVGKAIGYELEVNPDLLQHHIPALRSALAWWEGNIPDEFMGNIKRVTRRVNGGTTGLAHRQELSDKARDALA